MRATGIFSSSATLALLRGRDDRLWPFMLLTRVNYRTIGILDTPALRDIHFVAHSVSSRPATGFKYLHSASSAGSVAAIFRAYVN